MSLNKKRKYFGSLGFTRLGILVLMIVGFYPVIIVSGGYCATYYVSPSGNDSSTGSLAQPWKTISKAASTLVAGDTVYIRAGTYIEQVIPSNSGSSSSPITYTNYPGESPVIDGQNGLSTNYTGQIHLYYVSHIVLDGLTITNAGPYDNDCGILVDYCNNITIKNNSISNTVSSGIGVWDSQYITVHNNEVNNACNDGEQECITIATTTDFTVSQNHVHHNGPGTNGGEGIDAKDGAARGVIVDNHVHDLTRLGIYVDAWDKHTYDIEIARNRVHNCTNDGITLASEQGGLLENIRVINNLVYKNRYSGLAITPNGDVANPPMRTLSVTNNTFYSNGDGTQPSPWGGGIVVDNPNIDTLVIRNNLLSNNLLFQIALEVSVASLTAEKNLIHGFRSYSGEIKGNSPVEGDPLFVNISQSNFHLQTTSPAIDKAAATNAPADDLEKISRPQGKATDIGAYEVALGGGDYNADFAVDLKDVIIVLQILGKQSPADTVYLHGDINDDSKISLADAVAILNSL